MGKRIVRVTLNNLSTKLLDIGYVGENVHTQVIIDCREVLWDYPEATVSMIVRSPSGSSYTVEPTVSEMDVVWDIGSDDVSVAGTSRIQLIFTSGTEIIRSAIGNVRIADSLTTT